MAFSYGLDVLVERLYEGTMARRLIWQPTVEDGTYRLLLDAGMIRISKSRDAESFSLVVMDDHGRPVDSTDGMIPASEKPELKRLYDAAIQRTTSIEMVNILIEIDELIAAGKGQTVAS